MISYDEWLKLTDEEQNALHLETWDTYKREGYPIALHAASRLALQSNKTILSAWIGTYHGGEYLLEFAVPSAELDSCPAPLSERFEGFRTMWHDHERMSLPQ